MRTLNKNITRLSAFQITKYAKKKNHFQKSLFVTRNVPLFTL